MDHLTIIGFIAGTLTTISFVPQVIKSLRTKETNNISLLMYIILVTGVFLWVVYGFLIKNPPLVFANAITLLLAGSVLYLKAKHK